jgi:hypothetical protein
MHGMSRSGRGRNWKVYRGNDRPALAEPESGDGNESLLEQASDPIAIAEDMLRELRAAEKEMIELIHELRWCGR